MEQSSLGSTTVVQVAITVPDIAAAARVWAALLGVTEPPIITTDPVEVARTKYNGAPTPARAKLAFFRLGQVQLELIEPIDGPSTWKDNLDAHGASLHHIAFEIKGMNEQLAVLAAHGAPLVQRGEYTGGRYAYVDATDRFGTVIELLEND